MRQTLGFTAARPARSSSEQWKAAHSTTLYAVSCCGSTVQEHSGLLEGCPDLHTARFQLCCSLTSPTSRHNVRAHLHSQLHKHRSAHRAAYGTGGTLKGVGQVLRESLAQTKILLCEPANAPLLLSGVKTEYKTDGSITDQSHPVFRPHLLQGWTVRTHPSLRISGQLTDGSRPGPPSHSLFTRALSLSPPLTSPSLTSP